jgi:hypothetical protein
VTDPTPTEPDEVGDFGVAGLCRGGQRSARATYATANAGPSVSDIAEDIADVGSFGEHGSVVDHALPDGDQARDVGATGSSQERSS